MNSDISMPKKVCVAVVIFLVWFFLVSLLYGNVSTSAFRFHVLQVFLVVSLPIVAFWSLILTFAFFKENIWSTAVSIAISLGSSISFGEPVKQTLGNFGTFACLAICFILGILLLHYR
jgi:hypothetical protein